MNQEFLLFTGVGFAAQLVDGALGMAYGVVSSTALLAAGVPPATVSAAVHGAKVATAAASAGSHFKHRNVNLKLLWPLSLGGVAGGGLGTYVLTGMDGAKIKPFVVLYLAFMGVLILWRAWRGVRPRPISMKQPFPLGLIGGFLDAIGGGGWGPTVTGTLMGSGATPREAVGTTNVAELFVAAAVSAAFLGALFTGHWSNAEGLGDAAWSVGGLVLGGVLAAPIAGWMTKILPARMLMWLVGVLVVGLAGYQAAQLFKLI